MTIEEFIKQRCEIDKITGYRCLDLDGLLKENEELKKQLEEYKENYQEELDENSKLSELWCDSRAKIRELERQLEYLRSGEYYNQLRFERNMLEYIVDNGEVSKEDKEFIDCTHRNTELLEQQKEFIKYLGDENDIFSVVRVKDVLSKYKEIIGVSDEKK